MGDPSESQDRSMADRSTTLPQQTPASIPNSTGVRCSAELEELQSGIESSCIQESGNDEEMMTSPETPSSDSLQQVTGVVPFYDDIRYGIQEEAQTEPDRVDNTFAPERDLEDDLPYGVEEENYNCESELCLP